MSWQGLAGHDDLVDDFRRCLAAGRLASTYLFVGPPGVGKRQFAFKLAQALLCERRPEEALDPCGECPSCQQVAAGTHPDVLVVSRPKDKTTIPVELLIGSGDKRMREGLCHAIGLKSFMGRRKIAIIDDADYLNVEGANCLLKTLEEPPPKSLLILIGTSLDRQLPTIRSRSQIVRFRPLPEPILARLLVEQQIVADAGEAARLAGYSEGSLDRAKELADPELWQFRGELLAALSQPAIATVKSAQMTAAFVDRAGSEATDRRRRLRQVIGFGVEFYRALLRSTAGIASPDHELQAAVTRAAQARPFDPDGVVAAVEASLQALSYVDRNVNLTTIVEWWLDELGQKLNPQPVGAR